MKFLKQKLRKITITAEVKIAELEDTVIELSKMKCRKRRKKKKTEKMIRVSVTCGKLSKIYTWAIESHEREKKEHKIIIITIIIIRKGRKRAEARGGKLMVKFFQILWKW